MRLGELNATAFGIGHAAATPYMPSSPTPLAFIGEEMGSVSSRKITSWWGMSACTGTS
jgi:hypothetical protein